MAKSVICSKCGAEQAIIRDENGNMNCVFCGEPLENLPDYEEGEGLDYNENKVVEVKPEGIPIETRFVLSEEEVEEALLSSGRLKERKIIPIIETVLLSFILLFMVLSVVCYFGKFSIFGLNYEQKPNAVQYLFIVVVAFFIPAVWVLPKFSKKKYIKSSTSGLEIKVNFYENLAEVVTSDGKESWQLLYDSPYNFIETEHLLMALLSNHQILVIPKRAFLENDEKIALNYLDNSREK